MHNFADEVEQVLTVYRRPQLLLTSPACSWPIVKVHSDAATLPLRVIRETLRAACERLRSHNAMAASYIHARYIEGETVQQIADHLAMHRGHLARFHDDFLREFVEVLAEMNQEARQRTQYASLFHNQLPVFGIAALIVDIVAKLHDPMAPRVIAIEGMGGLGKTTLAERVARACTDDPTFHGIAWVTAQPVVFDPQSAQTLPLASGQQATDDILQSLARQLGIQVTNPSINLEDAIVSMCTLHPYLIIIDNLETITDVERLAPLIQHLTQGSRVVVTSREDVMQALPMGIPRHRVPMPELDISSSYALLRHAASYTGARDLADAPADDLALIYDVTGGNPLALWLVAGQAYGQAWRAFVHDLTAQRPQERAGPALYQYLYRRTWDQLTDDARDVLFAMLRWEHGAELDHLIFTTALPDERVKVAIGELQHRMLFLRNHICYAVHRLTISFLRTNIVGWREGEPEA